MRAYYGCQLVVALYGDRPVRLQRIFYVWIERTLPDPENFYETVNDLWVVLDNIWQAHYDLLAKAVRSVCLTDKV